MDMDKRAEQIYQALIALLHDSNVSGAGILTAIADARASTPYAKVAPKTRLVFMALADNLTRIQAKE